jgi:hypothetical protein
LTQESARDKRLAFTEGCQFVVVGVSEDGSDPAGKTELVRQSMDMQTSLPALKKLFEETRRMEKYGLFWQIFLSLLLLKLFSHSFT